MKKLAMALVPFLVLGCSGDPEDANGDGIADGVQDPNNVSVVVPATPKGTVSGQVLGTNLTPLADVNVALTIGGGTADSKKATTNAEGNFVFNDMPGGAQVLLTFSKQGYSTLRSTSTVPTEAGNVPINNGNASFGPVTLAQLNGSLRFQVVSPTGTPAAGVKATLEATPAGAVILGNSNSASSVVSTVVVEATANAQGLLSFDGIPAPQELARLNGTYRLWVSPMDANNDGIPETAGYVDSYAGSTMAGNSTLRLISLPYARPGSATLQVSDSNVGSLKSNFDVDPIRNMVKSGESIHVFFNQAVAANSVLVRLTDEYAKEALPVSATVNNGGYSATITPGQGIQEGREYNITLRAVSLEGGSIYTTPRGAGFFFGGDLAAPRNPALAEIRYQESVAPPNAGATQINEGEMVYVNFNVPVTNIFSALNVQVFFNADIDGNGTIGKTSVGEVGNDSGVGLNLVLDEPFGPYTTSTNRPEQPIFPVVGSNYSTRYRFQYTGCGPYLGTAVTCQPLNPANASLVVAFSKLLSKTTTTYETIWGQPLTSDMSLVGVATQPAAVLTP